MKSNEKLDSLIKTIKTGYKQKGERLTNDVIAAAIGISRAQLQKYLNGSENIQSDTFELLYKAYGEYLQNSPEVKSEEDLVSLAMLKVVYKEMAKIKSKVENRPITDCLDDLESETKLIMRELLEK